MSPAISDTQLGEKNIAAQPAFPGEMIGGAAIINTGPAKTATSPRPAHL